MRVSILLGCLLALALSLDAQNREWSAGPKDCCGMRTLRQPAGPFAVLLYREDALGNYLAVVYADPIGAPSTSGLQRWTLDDRYWHDPIWGASVTAYRWSIDG